MLRKYANCSSEDRSYYLCLWHTERCTETVTVFHSTTVASIIELLLFFGTVRIFPNKRFNRLAYMTRYEQKSYGNHQLLCSDFNYHVMICLFGGAQNKTIPYVYGGVPYTHWFYVLRLNHSKIVERINYTYHHSRSNFGSKLDRFEV